MSHASTDAKEPMGCWPIIFRFLLLVAEVTPLVYVSATGHVPTWVRIWIAAWLSFWFIGVIVKAISLGDER